MFYRLYKTAILFITASAVNAATITGKVTDENNEPLSFASVYQKGTTEGVTTNKDGNYSIELSVGNHDLFFQFIGYKIHSEKIKIESAEQKLVLNVKMQPQPYEIAEVTVKANAEDPAYEIIRNAIRMRKYYLNQAESYSCDVYIKGVQRLNSYPKKFMGIDINATGDIDTKTGIFYLSESISKFYFRQPDKVHETMVSSKVSGNNKAFSYNRTSDLLLNFYENLVQVQVLSKRGFVSPIAENAMFYYNYRFAGVFYENGKAINKIAVIPKRKYDPVFRGYIYIMENSWRIHSTDLYLVKDAGIEVVDTLRINDVFLPVAAVRTAMSLQPADEIWMLFSNKLTFGFSIFGFRGNGMFLSIHSKYNVKSENLFPKLVTANSSSGEHPDGKGAKVPPEIKKIKHRNKRGLLKTKKSEADKSEKAELPIGNEHFEDAVQRRNSKFLEVPKKNISTGKTQPLQYAIDTLWENKKKFSSGELMKVNDDANKKDSVYWAETRPVPLTTEEAIDYIKKDSIQIIRESKPFLDSVDKETNKFKPISLIFGYSYTQRYKKRTISFSPMIENVQFNTVQGWVAASEIEILKEYGAGKNFRKTIAASYGFSDKRINVSGKILYEFNPKKFTSAEIDGGRQTVQFNDKNPISPLINSVYTIIDKNNFMKLYQKDFLKISCNSELTNGVYIRSFIEYADRSPLFNTSDFILFPAAKNYRTYSSNDPLFPAQDSVASFTRNQLLEFNLNMRLRFKQKYISRPDEKWVYGSKYPTLYIEYRKGISAEGNFVSGRQSALYPDANYDFVKISISDRMKFGLLGRTKYVVSGGKFLNNSSTGFMDYYHFSGNKTIFSNFDFTGFQTLDYYAYSTNNYFLEAHYEHDFAGFILNKFPLLRKLKVNELAGFHFLYTEKIPDYTEVFFGLEKLNFARADVVLGFTGGKQTGIVVRLGLKIGGQ